MPFDREGPVPLWRQLATHYRRKILSGELPPGRRLPSKPYMEHEHDVSQKTVEHAMKVLREQGLIETSPGKGLYVLPREHWRLRPEDLTGPGNG